VAYEGGDFTGGAFNQIQLTGSTDGRPELDPTGTGERRARLAGVHTEHRGHPGRRRGHHLLRRADAAPGNTTTLPTSTWLTVSPRGGTRFGHERQIAPVFDFLAAPDAGGAFLGDYEGLVATATASGRCS